MRVPKENILGQLGRGLQAALTVLNFGRVTFGATCTGHAKACIKAMTEHAKTPRAVPAAARRVPAGAEEDRVRRGPLLRDGGGDQPSAPRSSTRASPDYMLETAILKVFATEHLWTDRQRHAAGVGRQGLLLRPADRAVDARRPHQHDRRGRQRRAQGVHRGRRLPRAGRVPEGAADEVLGGVKGFFKRLARGARRRHEARRPVADDRHADGAGASERTARRRVHARAGSSASSG